MVARYHNKIYKPPIYFTQICFIFQDWSDLIEYVINTFIKKPHALQSTSNIRLDIESFDDGIIGKPAADPLALTNNSVGEAEVKKIFDSNASNTSKEK